MINNVNQLNISNKGSEGKITHIFLFIAFVGINVFMTLYYALDFNTWTSYYYQYWDQVFSLYQQSYYRDETFVVLFSFLLRMEFGSLFFIFFAKLIIDISFEMRSKKKDSYISHFFTYLNVKYSGIPFYQILLSTTLTFYFSLMYITFYRKIDEG